MKIYQKMKLKKKKRRRRKYINAHRNSRNNNYPHLLMLIVASKIQSIWKFLKILLMIILLKMKMLLIKFL